MDKVLELFARMFDQLTWRSRLVSIVFVILIVFWIDTQMGFTYHYFMDRKLEEIGKINLILKDTTIDNNAATLLERERISIISKSRGFLEPMERHEKATGLMFHLSYSWVMVIIVLALPYSVINSRATTKEKWSQFIGAVIMILIVGGLLYFLAKGISVYLNTVLLYIVNSFLQLGIMWLLIQWSTRQARKALRNLQG